MKNLITTIVLVVLTLNTVNAQISRPKVSVKRSKIDAKTRLGLKINDLKNLKSIDDFKKLKISTNQASEEQSNANPSQSWSINLLKLRDGSALSLRSLNGHFTMMGLKLYAYAHESAPNSGSIESGPSNSSSYSAFPLKLQFRAVAGAEYILKIKGNGRSSRRGFYIYVANKRRNEQSSYIQRIDENNRGEYIYVFQGDHTGYVDLYFSTIPQPSSRERNWLPLIFKEISIDRIN